MQFRKIISQSNARLQQNKNFGRRYGRNMSFFTVNYEGHNRDCQSQGNFLDFSDFQESEGGINFESVSFNFSVKIVKFSFETSVGKINLT